MVQKITLPVMAEVSFSPEIPDVVSAHPTASLSTWPCQLREVGLCCQHLAGRSSQLCLTSLKGWTLPSGKPVGLSSKFLVKANQNYNIFFFFCFSGILLVSENHLGKTASLNYILGYVSTHFFLTFLILLGPALRFPDVLSGSGTMFVD